jgi:hypothetical protein
MMMVSALDGGRILTIGAGGGGEVVTSALA